MVLTHTTQLFSVILLPEKYDRMEYDNLSTSNNFNVKFKNGAIAFVPIYDGEIMRGIKLPELRIEGATHTWLDSWSIRIPTDELAVNIPVGKTFAVNNNTSNFCEIAEFHISSTTSFS